MRAVELAPERPEANLELAVIELMRGYPKAASELARRACSHDSASGDGLLLLGCASFRMGNLAAAEAAFAAAVPRLSAEIRARFDDAYTYTVRRLDKKGRSGRAAVAALQASREETNVGPLLRQFLSIPVRPLAAGVWGLTIEVLDLVAGTTATQELHFARE